MKFTLSPIKLSAFASRCHRGFSLLEIVISLTIMSVLVVAMGSALLVATRGMPDSDSPLAENISSARVIDQIAGELQYAFTVVSASTTGIAFIVERNGAPVTINYSWSETAGDPLVRQYDGGASVDILPNVTDFNLSYDLGAAEFTTLPTEGSEIELVNYEPEVYSGNNFSITLTDWTGQYFKPTLPIGADSWRVTRVVFRAKRAANDLGQTHVQLRTADENNMPTTNIIESVLMLESDLTNSYTWRQFTFSNVAGIAPEDGLCLVLQLALNQTTGRVEWATESSGLVTTSDGGSNWNFNSDKSLIYYVYGKVTMPGEQAYPIHSIKIGLDTGLADATPLQTTALLLNQPTKP